MPPTSSSRSGRRACSGTTPTASCSRAHYKARNPDTVERVIGVEFHFPSADTIYDNFVFRVNGEAAPPAERSCRRGSSPASPSRRCGEVNIDVAYASRGLDDWTYAFADKGVAKSRTSISRHHRFHRTSTSRPAPCRRRRKAAIPRGWELGWHFDSLVTGQPIGVDSAEPAEPRPAGRAPDLLRARVAALLPGGDGDSRRARRPEPAPGELRLPLGGVLRLPPAARLSGGPHLDPPGVPRSFDRQRLPRRVVPADCGGHALRHRARGARAVRVPRALQLRVLLRGVHRPHRHLGADRHAIRPDAGHRRVDWGAVFAARERREA